MGTVIDNKSRGNAERHQRWDRIERVELCERYGDLQAQGLSQRQAAKELDVPRSTLQAWRAYHERLDESPVLSTWSAACVATASSWRRYPLLLSVRHDEQWVRLKSIG